MVTSSNVAAAWARYAVLSALVTLWVMLPQGSARADIESYAIVQDDATLIVRNRHIRLFGIYVPDSGSRVCGRTFRPARCGSRAAIALDFKIQRFVRCIERGEFQDGSISAVCFVNYSHFERGEDLGAYLVGEGLALAGPDAPFEYRALERIAEANGRGLWGFQADSIRRR